VSGEWRVALQYQAGKDKGFMHSIKKACLRNQGRLFYSPFAACHSPLNLFSVHRTALYIRGDFGKTEFLSD
jgi:hypothetical protein